MKCILISESEKSEDFLNTKKFLKSEKIDFEAIFAKEKHSLFNKNFLHLLQSDFSFCIFLDSQKISECENLQFLFGCVFSMKTPTFFYPKNLNFDPKLLPAHFFCFENLSSLFESLKINLDGILREENRHAAYQELFNDGFPLTGDSFAQAIAKEKFEIVERYIKAGMSIDGKNSEGVPMLCVAVRNDCINMTKWLVEKGANVNSISLDRGYTPVMDAVWRSNVELTKFLISKGATLDTISKEGQSILVLAVGIGNPKICEILLANGANSETKDKMGMSARAYAMLFKKPAIVEVFKKYPAQEQK